MTEHPAPGMPVVRERSELDDLARLGQWLSWSESGKDDERSRGAAAALRLYYARELGLTPMAAAELTVINGRLYVGAALLRALARRAGYRVQRVNGDDNQCTARIVQISTLEILGEATFTIEQARTAGLIRDRSPWKTHPARMLWARASKNAIVDFAPEVALGIALDDELQELDPPRAAGDGYTDVPWDDEPDDQVEDEEPVTDDAGVDVDDIEF